MLESINNTEDLKKLTLKEKEKLAEDIRKYIIEVISKNGGHLASVHKILTGRKEALRTIRKLGGIAGFPKTKESKTDCFNTGHSSTSISAAMGMAKARDLKNEKH